MGATSVDCLLTLAIEQRHRLNFEVALQLFEAAGLCAAADSSVYEDRERIEALGHTAAMCLDAGESMSADAAESLLGKAQHLSPAASFVGGEEAAGMRAAATLGRADLLRLLGKPLAAAALLDELCPEDEPANEDVKLVADLAEAPAALLTFWLEVCSGCGGEDKEKCGRGRLDVMVELAYRFDAAPRAPEAVWRALGASCVQRPAGDDGPTGDDGQWAPADGRLSFSAIDACFNPECLLDVAMQCMWGRRPKDSMKALEKLEEVASLQRWSLPHCASLPKIVRDARDRFEAAAALLGRATWLLTSATRRDEAFSSYWNALRLLRECWQAEPLPPAQLRMLLDVGWRVSELALDADELRTAGALLNEAS